MLVSEDEASFLIKKKKKKETEKRKGGAVSCWDPHFEGAWAAVPPPAPAGLYVQAFSDGPRPKPFLQQQLGFACAGRPGI